MWKFKKFLIKFVKNYQKIRIFLCTMDSLIKKFWARLGP